MRDEIRLQSSPFYAFLVYREIDQLARRWGSAPERVLELGPGSSLGTLYCFAAGGAERSVGVDIAPIQKLPEFYQILKDYLACVGAFVYWRPFHLSDKFDKRHPSIRNLLSWENIDAQVLYDRLEYYSPVAAHELPFVEGDFDLIYSHAAMEHFDRPHEVVKEISRILAPGGLTIHAIDLHSHSATGPLSHLQVREDEYKYLTQKYDADHGIDKLLEGEWVTQAYCNRFLASDWHRVFTSEGLEILQFDIGAEVDPASIDPTQFSDPFSGKTREELAPLLIFVVARKPYSQQV